MSEELIELTFLCRICLIDKIFKKPLDMILSAQPDFTVDDNKGKFHWYVCDDCKDKFGKYFL